MKRRKPFLHNSEEKRQDRWDKYPGRWPQYTTPHVDMGEQGRAFERCNCIYNLLASSSSSSSSSFWVNHGNCIKLRINQSIT